MAGYNGRRAPNFSQYLDDLNTIPSPYDQALQQQQQQQNTINFDEELALFTNAEFFDFDKFGDLSLPSFDTVEDKNTNAGSRDQTQNEDMKFLDFLNGKLKATVGCSWSRWGLDGFQAARAPLGRTIHHSRWVYRGQRTIGTIPWFMSA